MKTIVIATDYSGPATAAVEYAAQLARHLQARLVLYNAYQLAIISSTPPATLPDVDELIALNRTRLEAMAAQLSERYQINAESTSTTLSFMDGLKKVVKEKQAALVVMGMKSHSLGRRYFGSSTTAVIEEAKFPVLVVPEEARFSTLSNILFACDYNCIASDNKLQMLTELAYTFGSDVKVLHVAREDKQATLADSEEALRIPAMEEILRGIPHTYHFMKGSDVVASLKQGIREHQANLLVMVPHTASLWEKLLNRSKTREMALESPVPLLVLPNIKQKVTAVKEENRPTAEAAG